MRKDIESLRIEMLYRQGPAAQLAGLVNIGIYSFCIYQEVSHHLLAAWILLGLLLTVFRISIQRWFLQKVILKHRKFSPELWENIFSVGTFLMGSFWGLAGTVILPENSVPHFAFLGFILAGNTAGAAVAYCTSVRASHAFLLPAVLPFALNMLNQGGTMPIAMALLIIVYTGLFSLTTKRMNNYVVESLTVKTEKATAIQELDNVRLKVAENSKMAALGEMAGGIAHEINNPLAVIRGSCGILKSLATEERADITRINTMVAKIDSTAVRIAKIVSGLKMFSRDAGKDPLEKVQLKEIVSQTLDFCQMRFANKEIPIHIDPINESLTVVCRSAQISQVLLNLLNNSFDAIQGQAKPWVKIQIFVNSSRVTLSVTDSGNGIPHEIQSQLMQPFFTTKKAGEGTGLGLSVAHGIMQGHGGALKLDTSSPNTRFLMEFSKAA
jgi:signal transduction histidine kinase